MDMLQPSSLSAGGTPGGKFSCSPTRSVPLPASASVWVIVISPCIAGLTGMAVGSSILPMLPTRFGVPGYIAPLAVITAGYALFQAANNTAVMTNIQPDQRGVTSGMLNLSRNLGLITGASVMGTVFALGSATTNIMTARPQAVGAGMRFTFAVAAALIVVALTIAVGSRALSRRTSAE
jgi:predicted MFS family arabinose efflux permease